MTTNKCYDPDAMAKALSLPQVKLDRKQELKWEETRAKFLQGCPAFSHIAYTMMVRKGNGDHLAMFIPDEVPIPVAATDGINLILKPSTFFNYSLPERVFIWAHEVMHCVYDHCGLMHVYERDGCVKYADGTKLTYIPQLMNMAMDYVINALLKECNVGTPVKEMPGGGKICLDPKYSAKGEESVIDVYRKLYKDKVKEVGGKPCADGDPGDGESFDVVLSPGAADGKDPAKAKQERDGAKAEWDTQVQAAINSARAQGKLPAGVERAFKGLLEPQISWGEHVQALFARKVGAGAYDFRRPDRRLIARDEAIYVPGRSGFGANCVVVGADTSGSIGARQLELFMAEMAGILEDVKPQRLVVMWTDSEVAGVDEVEDAQDLCSLKPKGGGGTDMGAIFREVDEMGLTPDAVVVLTDGYTPFPDEVPRYPVIWCSIATPPEGYPWGDVVMLPKVA
jgi:predicted metal-dependent peptidase